MTQSIDDATVRHVAHLARLQLTDEEVHRFAAQLSLILEYVAQLSRVDTRDVPPTAHPLPIKNVFREDEVAPSWEPDLALRNAPARQGDFFKVPKVLDQESA